MKRLFGYSIKEFTKLSLSQPIQGLKQTKIIGTIGPASDSEERLLELIDNGLNIFRLNMNHGTFESHAETLRRIRKVVAISKRQGSLPIMLDLKGPTIRTGMNVNSKPLLLKKGESVKVTTNYSHLGTTSMISCSYAKLLETVKVGDLIYVGDGNLTLVVEDVNKVESYLTANVANDYVLGNRKNVNLPGNKIDLPTITLEDEATIRNFVVPNKIDMVAVSFCRSAKDIQRCRSLLGERASVTQVIAKIENEEGISELREIIGEADGVMIARGDLGMEIPVSDITTTQKYITQECRRLMKPVINATQLLESMIENSRPTRAEIADVTNSIFDGNDCVMLSGETSIGKFPVEAVRIMSNIARRSEQAIDYSKSFFEKIIEVQSNRQELMIGAVAYSLTSNADLIVIVSSNIEDARFCSQLRPQANIMSVVDSEETARKLEIYTGLYSSVQDTSKSLDLIIEGCVKCARSVGVVEDNGFKKVVVIDIHNMQIKFINA